MVAMEQLDKINNVQIYISGARYSYLETNK